MRTCLVVFLIVVSILMALTLDHLTGSSRAIAKTQNSLTQSGMSAQRTLSAEQLFLTATSGPKSNFPISNIEPSATSTFSSAGQKRVQGTDETFARLITKTQSDGPVRVIVGLNTAFQPEGFLANDQLVDTQREGIAQAQDSLIAQLTGFNVHSITPFTFIPFMAMEIDAVGLTFLQNSSQVSSIEEDLPRPLALAESVPLIGGTAAWASGFSGAGQTVAILDSGVDKTHSFMSGKVVSEACYSTTNADFTSVCPGGVTESTSPGSGVNCPMSLNIDCAHGTHVAGIAAGKGTSFSGVAKDANIIAIQVFSQPVGGGRLGAFDSNMISGLQRIQQLSGSFNIAAVNLSIGGGLFTGNCDGTSPAMKAAIDNLRSISIATVIASGNDGSATAISYPACISSAISTGSTDDGSLGTTANTVSSFSNSASFLNLLAPGRWINSSVPGGNFQNFQGTSMATPHVAGAWAVLKSKAPSATVDQVLQALTSTGLQITDSRNGITKPRIKVDDALNALPGGTKVLTVASSNPNSGVAITVSPNDNNNLGSGTTQFSRTYNQNTNVTLIAPTTAGINNFQKWQRDGVDWSNNQLTSVAMDANHTLTAVYVTPTRNLTVASSNPNSGVSITVSPNDNSNLAGGTTQFSRTYNLNQNVTLTAPATVGINTFQKWQRDGVDVLPANQAVSVAMDADHTMTAVYVTPTRNLTVASLNPDSGVSITVSPNDNSNLGGGTTQFSRTYNLNQNVTLTAPATVGINTFQKWQRDGVDVLPANQAVSVAMDADHTMTAVYVTPTRTLTVASSNPNSGVSITVSPNDNSNLAGGTTQFNRTYNLNQNVTLTAPATVGINTFQKWQRDGVDVLPANQVISVAMDANHTLTAVYVTPTRTLTVASSNPASGVSITVSPNDNSNLGSGATQFSRTYNLNQNVTLTAPATVGINTFQKWQRDGVDVLPANQAVSVAMDADHTMTAVYVTPTRTLTVASSNPNSGVSITVSPNDNSNLGGGTTQFNRTYNLNQNVTLTAPATVGINTFQKWQRDGVDVLPANQAVSVAMDADHTLTAVYVTPTRNLTVASSNPNSGVSITVSPNDNSNQGSGATQFSRTYNLNTNVTLTAPATVGINTFQKWQRDGVDFSSNLSTNVTMDADHTLTAVYVTPTRTLTVASSNPGSGVSITVSPNDNNNLGSGTTQFTRTYNLNTNVTLTAPATAGGNDFQKWQRNGTDWSTNRSTSVTMDANYTLTAIYITPTRTLTVASSNPNSGVNITVSPNDNSNLGSGATPLSRIYNLNTIVTLTAPTTAGGQTFYKWQRNGVDFSINPTINLTMNSDYTMTAVYGTRRLTISSNNPNSGVNITVSPNDTNNLGSGTTSFSRTYNLNTSVTLTTPATAGANIFQKWQRNGVDFSTNPSIGVTMDVDYNLMAVYVAPPASVQTLSVAATGPPDPPTVVSITVSPNDNNNQGNGTAPFSRSYNHNTTVTLTAPGLNFRKWQRNGLDWSTTPSTTVMMDSNYTMTAVYSAPILLRTLNVASSNPNSGVSINLFPNDINNQGGGATQFSRTYSPFATVTLAAPATAGGNTFQKWQRNGVDFSTNPIVDVTMDLFTVNMTAVYVGPPTQTLTVASSNPNSGVNITVSPNDNSNLGNGTTQFSRTYSPNTNVTLTAPATASGNNFQKWQRNGVDFSTNPSTSVTMDIAYTMTAVYVTPTRTLTVASSNPNSGVNITISPNDNANLGSGTTQFSRTYNLNTNVTLSAPATAGGNNFQKWQRNGVDWSTNSSTSVTMDANYTMTAVYAVSGGATTLVASPASVEPGGAVNVNWTAPANHSGSDWIGLFRTDAPNTTWVDFKYVPAGGSGSLSFTAPATPGSYEFRYLPNNGFTSTATSNSFTVNAGGGSYSLSASVSALPGATITVNWTAPGGHSTTDWIGLYRVGTPDSAFISYQYLTAATAGTFSFVAPATEGGYEFRLYPNNGFTSAATSNQVGVSSAVALNVNVTNVGPGGTVTVDWSSSTTRAANDWIGLYLQGAADTNYISFQYIGTAGTSGSRTFTMPNQNGVYEFRYFLSDTYGKAATSTSITLTGGSNFSEIASLLIIEPAHSDRCRLDALCRALQAGSRSFYASH